MQIQIARRMANIQASAIREILKVTERPDVLSFAGGLPAPELFPVEAMAAAHADSAISLSRNSTPPPPSAGCAIGQSVHAAMPA